MSNTVIQLQFLEVEAGEDYLVTIPEDSTAEDMALVIRNELHKGGIILTQCYIDHMFRREN